jgi:TetR/AcrR family transcriptional regulator, lmrAB and yxaGH operons repressor
MPNVRYNLTMALQKVPDTELLEAAAEVFRSHGFEGTTLKQLSDATGLEKASLYHRFPGGKDEIAIAVAEKVNAWFALNVFEPLKGQGTPNKRLRLVGQKLLEFYGDGMKSCTLDTLSLPGGSNELAKVLREGLMGWIDAFAQIAEASGCTSAVARSRAEQAIMELEGSLVMSRVLHENRLFLRFIERLPKLLLG